MEVSEWASVVKSGSSDGNHHKNKAMDVNTKHTEEMAWVPQTVHTVPYDPDCMICYGVAVQVRTAAGLEELVWGQWHQMSFDQ